MISDISQNLKFEHLKVLEIEILLKLHKLEFQKSKVTFLSLDISESVLLQATCQSVNASFCSSFLFCRYYQVSLEFGKKNTKTFLQRKIRYRISLRNFFCFFKGFFCFGQIISLRIFIWSNINEKGQMGEQDLIIGIAENKAYNQCTSIINSFTLGIFGLHQIFIHHFQATKIFCIGLICLTFYGISLNNKTLCPMNFNFNYG